MGRMSKIRQGRERAQNSDEIPVPSLRATAEKGITDTNVCGAGDGGVQMLWLKAARSNSPTE